jgi:hypothetical protein
MHVPTAQDQLKKHMTVCVLCCAGHLNRDQFVRCMFLMDGLRRGLQLPAVLPPGPWPQVGWVRVGGVRWEGRAGWVDEDCSRQPGLGLRWFGSGVLCVCCAQAWGVAQVRCWQCKGPSRKTGVG